MDDLFFFPSSFSPSLFFFFLLPSLRKQNCKELRDGRADLPEFLASLQPRVVARVIVFMGGLELAELPAQFHRRHNYFIISSKFIMLGRVPPIKLDYNEPLKT